MSPSVAPPGRRNRTRQRARILAWLREVDHHPTAAEVHEALLPEFPRLSPGTVYRNLQVLVEDGQVEAVPSPGGQPARYDGNRRPHNHFICETCGAIRDVELPAPRGLRRRLEREYELRAQRVRIDFYGLCPECGPEPEALGRSPLPPTKGSKR